MEKVRDVKEKNENLFVECEFLIKAIVSFYGDLSISTSLLKARNDQLAADQLEDLKNFARVEQAVEKLIFRAKVLEEEEGRRKQ